MTRYSRFGYYGDGTPTDVAGVPVGSQYIDRSSGVQYIRISSGWTAFGLPLASHLTVYAAGTVATLAVDGTQVTLNFGTTDPALVLSAAGSYLIHARMVLDLVGTTVTTQTIAARLYRTNNTAAAVTGAALAIDLPAMTTLTHTLGAFTLPPVIYTTTEDDDSIELQAAVNASLGAGSITATAASIVAQRIA